MVGLISTEGWSILRVVLSFGTIVGGMLCLMAMMDYNWRAARSNKQGRGLEPPWKNPFLSARGQRRMRWGSLLFFPSVILLAAIRLFLD